MKPVKRVFSAFENLVILPVADLEQSQMQNSAAPRAEEGNGIQGSGSGPETDGKGSGSGLKQIEKGQGQDLKYRR